MTGPLTIYDPTKPVSPVLVLAYAGWNDAGDAATAAGKALLEQFSMTRYASIDMEEFLDFTVVRPHVRPHDGEREIVWPTHEFLRADLQGSGSDLIVGLGVEPHLRWRSYARAIVELAQASGSRLVVLLGAFLDDVIYSQPVDVRSYASEPDLAPGLEMVPPSYEGPTGIVGVLGEALRRAQLPTVSLWASIPHYVPTKPNARGALALLQAVQAASGLALGLGEVERDAAEFDERVAEVIATDPQLQAYVRELKRRAFTQ